MITFFQALSILIGIVVGLITIYQLLKSHPKRALLFGAITVMMVVVAFLSVIFPSMAALSITPRLTPLPTKVLSPTSVPLPDPTPTPSAPTVSPTTTTLTPQPTVQPVATPSPSPQLLYKENFTQNSSSWTAGGYTVEDANSIVCPDGDTPLCSGIINYAPSNANYTLNVTVRFTRTSYVGIGSVLCLEERTNTAFPQGVQLGFNAVGAIYNGCLDNSDQNYIGQSSINLMKAFNVAISFNGSTLSILVSQQGNNFSYSTTVTDTDPGKISIIAYYPVVVSDISIDG